MEKTTNSLPKISVVASVVAAALSLGVASAQSGNDARVIVDNFKQHSGFVKPETLNREQQQEYPDYYIVELESQPIAMRFGDAGSVTQGAPANRLNLEASDVQQYANQLQAEQQRVAQQLQNQVSGLNVVRQLSIVSNSLIVEVPKGENVIRQMNRISGVKRVHAHKMYYANMDTSLDLINAPVAWDLIGSRDEAGEGVRIAIIDGGINSGHEMFAANGHTRPEGLPNDDYCSVVDASFCNDKLALARYYTPTFQVHPDEHISPEDFGGHGTHVAGTAAGNHVSISYNGVETAFSGVAPGATLMAYKALFNDPAGQGGGSNIMLVQALEDAVADGADVINNSWGGGPGNPEASPYYAAFQAAEAAGVVMVTAAGNSGPAAGSIGCPSCIEEGLTVASTQHGRVFGNQVEVEGLENAVMAYPGDGDFTITDPISGPMIWAGAVAEDNALACAPFEEGSLEGHIVFTMRGECAFSDKANNLEDAGAIGMVMGNNEPGIIIMTMPEATLPSVTIELAGAEAVTELLQDGSVVEGTISASEAIVNDNLVDVMSGFSSRGPNFDPSFLKPDIAAPGSDILSAIAGENDAYSAAYSGTSMASPHVAGAAALLRQVRPELDAKQVKSVLMTSSNPNVRKEDAETPADAFDIGAGRLDIAAAMNTAIAIDGPSIVGTTCVVECTFERTVTNLLGEAGEWHGEVAFSPESGLYAELNNDSLSLDANGSATFRLTIDARTANEGWQFGHVIWRDASGQYADVRMPVAVSPSSADNRAVLDTFVTSGEAIVGEPMSIRSMVRDAGFEIPMVSLISRAPEGTSIDPESVQTEAEYSTITGSTVAGNNSAVTVAATMSSGSEPSATIEPIAFPYAGQSITELTDDYATVCGADQDCDEVTVGLDIGMFGGFEWDGVQVDYISVSENGFIALGDQSVGGTFTPQELPNGQAPFGKLAPFWADFEVAGPDAAMHYNLIEDANGDLWFAWEWHQVPEFLGALTGTGPYTFSVWIKLGSDEVVFNYVDITGPGFWGTSVGVEDMSSNVGISQFFGSEGTLPQNGDSWITSVDSQTGYVAVDYDVTVDNFGSVSNASVSGLRTDNISYDLADYVSTETEAMFASVTLDTYNGDLNAVTPIFVSPAGEVTVAVVEEPAHGTVSFTGTEFTYVGDGEFTGEDSFSYQLVDSAGNTSETAEVIVNVELEPQPPTVSVSVSSGSDNTGAAGSPFVPGDGVTLTANASDPNGDALTYTWAQTSGTSVDLSGGTSAAASFTAPDETSTLVFEVTVSDGEFEATESVSVNVERSSSKKWYEGNFGAALVLLGLPLVWLRRRALRVKRG
ncbi:hypothetical protein CWE08_01110 [Aliidiomarina iranensis]|uniref:Peptidase S8 n=1 Tax=Aliidiomarina iranensis TaxID=1434071 RepID=A0A432W243_9GAMM|nr:S8 family serine peptidase [Aliidiomarina iranensis]RUO23281.1 hypothetical protein CWE08_01110 [Aliidiomarina iranensis]